MFLIREKKCGCDFKFIIYLKIVQILQFLLINLLYAEEQLMKQKKMHFKKLKRAV